MMISVFEYRFLMFQVVITKQKCSFTAKEKVVTAKHLGAEHAAAGGGGAAQACVRCQPRMQERRRARCGD